MPSSNGREYSVRVSCLGGIVVMVRHAMPDDIPGEWVWSKWIMAGQSDMARVLAKLSELNKS